MFAIITLHFGKKPYNKNSIVKTRQYIILGIIGFFIAATVVVSKEFKKSNKKKKDKVPTEYKIETKVLTVHNKSYPAQITFTGRVRAIDRVDLFTEVTGVLLKTRVNFKEGNSFRKGEVLIKIDDRELRLQIISKKSKFINTITKIIPDLKVDFPADAPLWENYLNSIDPKKPLSNLPVITNKKLTYFVSGRNINDAYFEIKSQETKLSKYTIRAPFNGIVSNANITQGTLVRAGQSLGEFIAKDNYELEAALSFKDLKFIKIGDEVKLHSKDLDKKLTGKIYRISDVINEETQSINIYIKIKSNGFIKEGMYLQGNAQGNIISNAFSFFLLLLQPDDILFTVNLDTTLKLSTVDVIKINNDAIIVRGLDNGVQIITKQLTRGIEGTKIEVIKD